MKMLSGVLALISLVLISCSDFKQKNLGDLGQGCFENGKCNGDLLCVEGKCEESATDNDITDTDAVDTTESSDIANDTDEQSDGDVGDTDEDISDKAMSEDDIVANDSDSIEPDEDNFQCNNTCATEGDKDCTGGQIRTCIVDGDGCLKWDAYVDCRFNECESVAKCKEVLVVKWGSDKADMPLAMDSDGSDAVYVSGVTYGALDGNTQIGENDIFLTKLNSNGDRIWTKQWGTAGGDQGYAVACDLNQNTYVAGYTCGNLDGQTLTGVCDLFVTKWSNAGTKAWTVVWGSTGDDVAFGVVTDALGNIYVTGTAKAGVDGNAALGLYDAILSKIKPDGTRVWTKQWGTSETEYGNSVAVDSQGNVYVTGYTNGTLEGNISSGGQDIFIAKYDSDGIRSWMKQWGTGADDPSMSIAVDSSGNIYLAGHTNGSLDGNMNVGMTDAFLTKMKPDGTKEWTRQWGTGNSDNSSSVRLDENGDVYVAGVASGALFDNTHYGSGDAFLTKWDSFGTMYWARQWGGYNSDNVASMARYSGRIFVTGHTSGDSFGGAGIGSSDAYLLIYAE